MFAIAYQTTWRYIPKGSNLVVTAGRTIYLNNLEFLFTLWA
jgi:hypothetical protein